MRSSSAEPRAANRWCAVTVLMLSIVAGLLAVQCANQPATPADAVKAAQLCVPRATPPSDRFSLVHGCITYTNGSEILAVDPNHSANRISLGPSKRVTAMAWSRDGSRLLLNEHTDSGIAREDLYVMKADGSQTRLTSDGGSTGGSFSPDGSKVAFARANDGLYVVDATGGTPQLIAKSYLAWWLGSPAWSPDGSRIAYMVYLEGGPPLTYEIWTVNPDGTNPRQLVDLGECGGGGCSGGLAWSPDGSMLAFHSMRDNLSTRTQAIYVVHADGSGLHRISDDAFHPSWSPDGSRIAFYREGELFTMALDGSDVTSVEGVVVPPPFGSAWVGVPSGGWAWNPVR
jgi:Tol biopolymer transport system component